MNDDGQYVLFEEVIIIPVWWTHAVLEQPLPQQSLPSNSYLIHPPNCFFDESFEHNLISTWWLEVGLYGGGLISTTNWVHVLHQTGINCLMDSDEYGCFKGLSSPHFQFNSNNLAWLWISMHAILFSLGLGIVLNAFQWSSTSDDAFLSERILTTAGSDYFEVLWMLHRHERHAFWSLLQQSSFPYKVQLSTEECLRC